MKRIGTGWKSEAVAGGQIHSVDEILFTGDRADTSVTVADLLQLALEERLEPSVGGDHNPRVLSEPESDAVRRMCGLIEENQGLFPRSDFTLVAAANALEAFVVERRDKGELRQLQDEFFESLKPGQMYEDNLATGKMAMRLSPRQVEIIKALRKPKSLEVRTAEYLALHADDAEGQEIYAEWETKLIEEGKMV